MSELMSMGDKSVATSIRNAVDSVFVFASTAILFSLVIIVVIQVLARVLSIPESQVSTSWIRPVSQYLLIIGTYIGGVAATSRNDHIRLGITQDYLEENYPRVAKISTIVMRMLVIVTLVIVFLATGSSALDGWTAVFGSVQIIKVGYIYLLMTIGVLFMTIFEMEKLYLEVANDS